MIRHQSVVTFLCCAAMLCLVADAEPFKYKLHFTDKLDSEWIHAQYSSITLIECASLSNREIFYNKYFGYNRTTCTLLKDTVDEDSCSQDNCTFSGIKIYKLREEVTTTVKPTTTTETTEPTTTTTERPTTTTTLAPTTFTTTTTSEPTTVTTEKTTTTKAPTTTTTTTTEAPTTTTTTTTEAPTTTTTTTTEAPTTTTTEATTTTTTEAVTTTTTKAPTTITTSTTTKATTTTTETPATTTTTAPTTTTEAPTTTTTSTTTTAAPTTTTTTTTKGTTTTTEIPTTTTTAKPLTGNCDEDGGTAIEIKCPVGTFLMNGFGSKSPFFRDATSPVCHDYGAIFEEDGEEIIFPSKDGITLSSKCPDKHIISKFYICVKNVTILHLQLFCNKLKADDIIVGEAETISEVPHGKVDCPDKTALNVMEFLDAGKTVVQVALKCYKLDVKDQVLGAADNADGAPG